MYQKWKNYLEQPTSIAPLITFRMAFGLVMLFSTLRYMWMGWVDTQLAEPLLHFSYYGFDWIQPLPRLGLYLVFGILSVACVAIVLGWYYRFFAVLFFLCFTYIELIDITYYLNHYYFVSIVAFLMIWVPANRYFALDAIRKPQLQQKNISRWCIDIFKLQIAIVYIYAGLAKINYDWLLNALPLSIWLPAKTSIPIIGFLFEYEITPYLFSWAGMLFDTFIIGALLYAPTRWLAYIAVVIFHTMTGILFQIGIFPLVMIFVVTIFFSPEWHQQFLDQLTRIFKYLKPNTQPLKPSTQYPAPNTHPLKQHTKNRLLLPFLAVFFLFQLVFPWRYLLYSGNLFWTEEGYRFSWRVMLMEKAGTATFYVKNGETGREGSVINHQFLNAHQEKQMAMQPDLILQFAHYLKNYYSDKGMKDPSVRAEVWVTLNGRPAKLLVDPEVDLTKKKDGWASKDWILNYEDNH